MILGPNYIYECPNCGKLTKRGSIVSGNTFGAKLFSDGSRYAPMLPEFPKLTKCEACNTILDLDSLEEVGVFNNDSHYYFDKKEVTNRDNHIKWKNTSIELFNRNTLIENITPAKFLARGDLYKALVTFPQYEYYIRQKIWWLYNQEVKNNTTINIQTVERDIVYIENCKALIELLDRDDEPQRIMIAELYRNIGEFDKCIELVNTLDISIFLKFKFIMECKRKNKLTFRCDEKALQEEQKRENEEKWKSRACSFGNNGYCDKPIGQSCFYCVKDKVHLKQTLYISRIGDSYVLTVDKDISNREAEIIVGFDPVLRDHYYHIDGKNPNPTSSNTIQLNEITIAGSKLIEMCEEIIEGKRRTIEIKPFVESKNDDIVYDDTDAILRQKREELKRKLLEIKNNINNKS